MQTERPKIDQINPNQKKLDIGDAINEAFEIYKKTAITSGTALMVLMSIIVFLGVVGISYFFRADELEEVMKNFNPDTLSANGLIIYFAVVILLTVFSSPFIAGLLKMAHDAANNLEVQFSSLYYYVNHNFFPDILLVTFFTTTVSIGLTYLSKLLIPGIGGEILAIITSYAVSILTFIALPLVLFKELSFIEALQTSVKQISQNFFVVLLLIIVAGLFSIVGIFAFCIGVFFTLPLVYAMQYVIQKKLS